MSDNVSPYVEIVEAGTSPSGKTKIWEVRNISKGTHENDVPGWIQWSGAWRGYVYVCDESMYDSKCLRQIADFIEAANKDHKEGKA